MKVSKRQLILSFAVTFSWSKIDKFFTIKLDTKILRSVSPGLRMETILCS